MNTGIYLNETRLEAHLLKLYIPSANFPTVRNIRRKYTLKWVQNLLPLSFFCLTGLFGDHSGFRRAPHRSRIQLVGTAGRPTRFCTGRIHFCHPTNSV